MTQTSIFVMVFLYGTTIIGLSHQGHYLVETEDSTEGLRIGRAEVKDDKTDDADTDPANELVDGGNDNDVPVAGLSQDVISKFEKLLTNITETMGDGKNITNEVYKEWGKSLEEIIEIGNKTMPMIHEAKITNDGIEMAVDNGDGNLDDKEKKSNDYGMRMQGQMISGDENVDAKEKKSRARRMRTRRHRRRM
eukprot:TRINITY_DN9033_c0_g1_i6.p1 TRINITY_DN9033_c0_g1~~TRINITY_DN9033_c0_g1_i6.p1  ORF type:complete len:207 (-),score=73.39 TRINITY_DN9033_c0_g1_i6:86-664(-)